MHVDTRPCEELEEMSSRGVKAVVSATYYPHLFTQITAETIFDHFDRILKFEKWRAEQCGGIKLFAAIGLNPVIIPKDYEKVLQKLPYYLGENDVVAIGEIGFEPGSKICPDLNIQERVILEQLDIAKDLRKPVIFHTSHTQKPDYVKRTVELVEKAGVSFEKVMIDHSDRTVAKQVLDKGAYLGVTVQPWRKLSATDAASIIKEFGSHHVLVDSDCSPLLSDHLSVPKTATELKKLGFDDSEVEKILYENPRVFYGLKI